AAVDHDLFYRELTIWEPIVDARSLLGNGGLAGRASALMNLRLDELDRASTWADVRLRAEAIHRIAHDDLPVIPLWQSVNHFAYRNWLQGIGDRTTSLYQDVDDWRKTFREERP
ncbi:MAG: peptide ABC transporter substrate-binding protein, partial [Planctomycetota bacterium]